MPYSSAPAQLSHQPAASERPTVRTQLLTHSTHERPAHPSTLGTQRGRSYAHPYAPAPRTELCRWTPKAPLDSRRSPGHVLRVSEIVDGSPSLWPRRRSNSRVPTRKTPAVTSECRQPAHTASPAATPGKMRTRLRLRDLARDRKRPISTEDSRQTCTPLPTVGTCDRHGRPQGNDTVIPDR